MAITQRRTRLQVRQSIGVAADALDMSGGSLTLAVTGTSSADGWTVGALNFGSSNEHRGKWALATEGTSNASSNVGLVRRISGFTSSNTNITFNTDWPASADTSQRFELWDEKAPPLIINELINQSISAATKKAAVPTRSNALHTGGGVQAFNFPEGSSFTGIRDIEVRESWKGESLTSADNSFSSAANTTISTDTSDLREGLASNRINIASGFSASTVAATDCFSAIDMAGYTHVELWMKSNVTTTSSAFQVRLGEGGTTRETLGVPAMGADSWNYHRLALANPELDTAITRFMVMTGASDMGSVTAWVDDVTTVRANTEKWARINTRFWGLDQDNRQLVFERDASIPYSLMRVTGVRSPNLLTTDSAVSEVSSAFIINSVTAKLLRSRSDFFAGDRDAAAIEAQGYESLAQLHYNRMGTPQGIRWLSDS